TMRIRAAQWSAKKRADRAGYCRPPPISCSSADGLELPAEDVVCFFSVFTHLLHEHSYLYLQEAKRVLKPGGRVVLSFLEFANPGHWPVFELAVRDASGPSTLVQFMSREGIHAWASHLGFNVEAMLDGDQPSIPRRPQPCRRWPGVRLEPKR